jgi:CDGSH-type Zn-finger protein
MAIEHAAQMLLWHSNDKKSAWLCVCGMSRLLPYGSDRLVLSFAIRDGIA